MEPPLESSARIAPMNVPSLSHPMGEGQGEGFPIAPAARPTLLLVDDDNGVRESMRFVFKEQYEVLTATNGAEALKLLESQAVDAAVVDIRMPGMSGLDLLEKIKHLSPTTGVIMLTGHESVDTARQALRLGASDYFAKPFDLIAMRQAVARTVERRLMARERHANEQMVEALRETVRVHRMELEMARQRGDLFAAAFHDMNNPLTFVIGSLELLHLNLNERTQLSSQELAQTLTKVAAIKGQAMACLDIANRFLTLFRSETRTNATTSLNQTLADMSVLLNKHRSRKAHQLEFVPAPLDVHARMKAIDLIQVLLNLTVNALECTAKPHRVCVSVKLLTESLNLAEFPEKPGTVFLNREGFANQPPLVLVEVEDDGPGISWEHLGSLFRTHFTTKINQGGTGLGMTIVHSLIRNAAGALYLRTAPNQGTCFSVLLPAHLPAKPDK
jgi:signal transduction histidine kinase